MNPQRVPKILTYRTPGHLYNGGPVLFQLSIVAKATPLSHQVRLVFVGGRVGTSRAELRSFPS